MERLDDRAIKKLSGPAWQKVRPHIEAIHSALTGVSPTAKGTLTTIYIKYTSEETRDQPFAVLWVKTSEKLVLGLALPGDYEASELTKELRGHRYVGLTRYLVLKPGDTVPANLDELARAAFDNTKTDS